MRVMRSLQLQVIPARGRGPAHPRALLPIATAEPASARGDCGALPSRPGRRGRIVLAQKATSCRDRSPPSPWKLPPGKEAALRCLFWLRASRRRRAVPTGRLQNWVGESADLGGGSAPKCSGTRWRRACGEWGEGGRSRRDSAWLKWGCSGERHAAEGAVCSPGGAVEGGRLAEEGAHSEAEALRLAARLAAEAHRAGGAAAAAEIQRTEWSQRLTSWGRGEGGRASRCARPWGAPVR